jgi:hypothetical protein
MADGKCAISEQQQKRRKRKNRESFSLSSAVCVYKSHKQQQQQAAAAVKAIFVVVSEEKVQWKNFKPCIYAHTRSPSLCERNFVPRHVVVNVAGCLAFRASEKCEEAN